METRSRLSSGVRPQPEIDETLGANQLTVVGRIVAALGGLLALVAGLAWVLISVTSRTWRDLLIAIPTVALGIVAIRASKRM